MGGRGSLFICLSLCLSVSPARGWVWGDVGGEGGLSTVREGRGGGRWKSEQNNIAQWELRCGWARGVEGGTRVRTGIVVVKETVICPRPGPCPQSSMTVLSLSFPIGKIFSVMQMFYQPCEAEKYIWSLQGVTGDCIFFLLDKGKKMFLGGSNGGWSQA